MNNMEQYIYILSFENTKLQTTKMEVWIRDQEGRSC